jgi:hypothetical protein
LIHSNAVDWEGEEEKARNGNKGDFETSSVFVARGDGVPSTGDIITMNSE